jgi:hypothetical protein
MPAVTEVHRRIAAHIDRCPDPGFPLSTVGEIADSP